MGRLFAVLVAIVVAVAAASGAPGGRVQRPAVLIIGDSVAGSLLEVPQSVRYLKRSYDLRLDLAVCRRLEMPSCVYQGSQPSTALEAVKARHGHVAGIVVVDVGYNDEAWAYRAGLDHVMRALVRSGARIVVWTTLCESGQYRSLYVRDNAIIRKAAKHWKQLRVADWNARARGRPWFGSDGLHLNVEGAMGLARLFKQTIEAARADRARSSRP